MEVILTALPGNPLGRKFVEIFSYPWQSIESENLAGKAQWYTNRYPITPRTLWRRWQDVNTLIGVRFGQETTYGVLDIDARSPYCNPEGIADIQAALETVGICRTIIVRSSWSGGIHLYLPLAELVSTFNLAATLQQCLQAQGLVIAKGQLEIFPNVKTYGVERIILYNAHRLPLQPQTGSCLLDDDLNPINSSLDCFFRRWDGAAAGQDLSALLTAMPHAREARKQASRRKPVASPKLAIWQQDLETEIAEGWTGHGQTNHLLKTVACHAHVFLGLEGDDLLAHTLATATHLPGYQQYCRHQHEINRKVKTWCRAVENYYWPVGSRPKVRLEENIPINQQRAEDARDRIVQAVEQIYQATEVIPNTISGLAQTIVKLAHCSLSTVYKHLSLWHPDHIEKVSVMDSPEPVLSHLESAQEMPSNLLEPQSGGLLHTEGGDMKCRAPSEAALTSEKKSNRGVRGDVFRFPQFSAFPETSIPLPIPFEEVQGLIHEQVRSLGWSLEQIRQFLAEHFGGRSHIWELQAHELTTYLYFLRTETLEPRLGVLSSG